MSLLSRPASRRLLAAGVVGVAAVIGLSAPAQAATHPSVQGAGSAPVLLGKANLAEPLGTNIVIKGTAPAGSTVDVYFHERFSAGYTRRRVLTADANGAFTFHYSANDDYRFYAVVGTEKSAGVLVAVRPTIDGPVTRAVPLGKDYTISGTYLPGETVDVRFHASGDGQFNFPTVRSAVANASGRWAYTYKATKDYRILVTGEANSTFYGANYLIQAR